MKPQCQPCMIIVLPMKIGTNQIFLKFEMLNLGFIFVVYNDNLL